MSELKATALFDQAVNLEFSEPLKALELLNKAVREYPETITVNNYVLDSIIQKSRYLIISGMKPLKDAM